MAGIALHMSGTSAPSNLQSCRPRNNNNNSISSKGFLLPCMRLEDWRRTSTVAGAKFGLSHWLLACKKVEQFFASLDVVQAHLVAATKKELFRPQTDAEALELKMAKVIVVSE